MLIFTRSLLSRGSTLMSATPAALGPAAAASSSAAGRRGGRKAAASSPSASMEDGSIHRGASSSSTLSSVGAGSSSHSRLILPPSAEGDGAADVSSAASLLSNPFRGIHGSLARSYRLDQLTESAAPMDLLLARQEKKSTAFSFLKFTYSKDLYEGHWDSLDLMRETHAQLAHNHKTQSGQLSRFSLFNNDLGLDSGVVATSYPLLIAQRLLMFPDVMRHFHTLCGRDNVPCDFYADVDLPGETPEAGEALLMEILNYLEVRLPGVGFTDPFFFILSNDNPSRDKVSYHIHARSMTYVQDARALIADAAKAPQPTRSSKKKKGGRSSAVDEDEEEDAHHDNLVNVVGAKTTKSKAGAKVIAFNDFRAVKLIADEVNQTLGRTVVDPGTYRQHAMLRCAFSSKLAPDGSNASPRRLMPLLKAKDTALQKRLTDMEAYLRTLTDPEILELTFCNRYIDDTDVLKRVRAHAEEAPNCLSSITNSSNTDNALHVLAPCKPKFKLIRSRHILGPQGAQALEYDAYGNIVSPFLKEAAKWRRYKTVVDKIRNIPPRAADSFDTWVRVGLALHNFSNEDHVFEEWVRFSLRCPQKYSREACRKKWVQFERNPDALNWRRGFNYLNSTIWKQV